MLKRILSALSGNKASPTASSAAAPIASTFEAKEELITVYDAYGREIK
jgi:hypothetical protein